MLVEERIPGITMGEKVEQALHVLRRLLGRDTPGGPGPHVHCQIRQRQFHVIPLKEQLIHIVADAHIQIGVERGLNPDLKPAGQRR